MPQWATPLEWASGTSVWAALKIGRPRFFCSLPMEAWDRIKALASRCRGPWPRIRRIQWQNRGWDRLRSGGSGVITGLRVMARDTRRHPTAISLGDYIEELTLPTQPGLWPTRRLAPALFTGLRGRFVQCCGPWTVTERLSPCSSRGPTGRSGDGFFNRTRVKSRHGECGTGCAAHLSTPRYNSLSLRLWFGQNLRPEPVSCSGPGAVFRG